MILLSIVIPTKNEEDSFRTLCGSLLKQAHKEFFEVVMVDDIDPHYEECVKIYVDALRGAELR